MSVDRPRNNSCQMGTKENVFGIRDLGLFYRLCIRPLTLFWFQVCETFSVSVVNEERMCVGVADRVCVDCIDRFFLCFFVFFVSVSVWWWWWWCFFVLFFFFCFQCLRKKICGICDSLLTCLGFCGGDDGGERTHHQTNVRR